ncbi:MAG: hypothetical protein ABI706_15405 [Ilumatobacteraceae bacterium]
MTIVVILVIVAVVVALAAFLANRRTKQKAEALRTQAQDHRDESKATQVAAARQETQADALVAKAEADLAIAEQHRNAATIKREVAADLNVRADNIDPDVTNTPS